MFLPDDEVGDVDKLGRLTNGKTNAAHRVEFDGVLDVCDGTNI